MPLSLFQPSFFTLIVGRRTDKGMRVTRATVPTRWPLVAPGLPRLRLWLQLRQASVHVRLQMLAQDEPTAKQMQGYRSIFFTKTRQVPSLWDFAFQHLQQVSSRKMHPSFRKRS